MTADERPGVSLGDMVYTADGHRLGEVVMLDEGELVIENGLVFRRYYVLDRVEIARSDHGSLVTSLTLDEAKTREQR